MRMNWALPQTRSLHTSMSGTPETFAIKDHNLGYLTEVAQPAIANGCSCEHSNMPDHILICGFFQNTGVEQRPTLIV